MPYFLSLVLDSKVLYTGFLFIFYFLLLSSLSTKGGCYSKLIDVGNSHDHWQCLEIHEIIVSLRDFMSSLNILGISWNY